MIVPVVIGSGAGKLTRQQIYYGGGIGARSVDIKPLYPNWRNLTIDNFEIKPFSIKCSSPSEPYSFNVSLAYNASTGIVTWYNGHDYSGTWYINMSSYGVYIVTVV